MKIYCTMLVVENTRRINIESLHDYGGIFTKELL